MKNITGTFAGIQRTLLSCLACSLATHSVAAFSVSRMVCTESIIAIKESGLNENHLFQIRKCNIYSINQPEKVYLPPLHIKLHLRKLIKMSLDLRFLKIRFLR
jgi:hypothetical protein